MQIRYLKHILSMMAIILLAILAAGSSDEEDGTSTSSLPAGIEEVRIAVAADNARYLAYQQNQAKLLAQGLYETKSLHEFARWRSTQDLQGCPLDFSTAYKKMALADLQCLKNLPEIGETPLLEAGVSMMGQLLGSVTDPQQFVDIHVRAAALDQAKSELVAICDKYRVTWMDMPSETRICPDCNGSGRAEYGTCPKCEGSGRDYNDFSKPCRRCKGTGWASCSRCDGKGEVTVQQQPHQF